jgi:hypothetical protein
MAELTNRLSLPSSIVAAVKADPYKGGGDISVTGLLRPAYQRKLEIEHGRKEDVSDRIWALIGQIGHSILENVPIEDNGTTVREQRLFCDFHLPGVGTKTLSGQFDLIEDHVLTDFKFCSVWTAMSDGKIVWEQQLNMLRYLANAEADSTGDDRYRVRAAQIIAVYRDWSKLRAKVEKDYPKVQIGIVPITLWPEEQVRDFIVREMTRHFLPDPPPCNDEERWKRPDVWAVMKDRRKTATKLCETEDEANEYITKQQKKKTKGAKPKWRVELRKGTFARCENYCAVSSVCPIWNNVPF